MFDRVPNSTLQIHWMSWVENVCSWLCSPVESNQCWAEKDCDWLSDRLTGCWGSPALCVYVNAYVCFSVGLLCLWLFFSLCIWFWTEAAVGRRLAQPASHTDGLEDWSDVMSLILFVFFCLLLRAPCTCPVGHASIQGTTQITTFLYILFFHAGYSLKEFHV